MLTFRMEDIRMPIYYVTVTLTIGQHVKTVEFDPDPDGLWASIDDAIKGWRQIIHCVLTQSRLSDLAKNADEILCQLYMDEEELDVFIWSPKHK